MKRKYKKLEKWTKSQIDTLHNYIKKHKQILITNFFLNIKIGYHKFRKPIGFFKTLSELVNKTPSQCKSKFQKYEDIIYTKILKIKNDQFNLYLYLRKNKIGQKGRCSHFLVERSKKFKLMKQIRDSIIKNFDSELQNSIEIAENTKIKTEIKQTESQKKPSRKIEESTFGFETETDENYSKIYLPTLFSEKINFISENEFQIENEFSEMESKNKIKIDKFLDLSRNSFSKFSSYISEKEISLEDSLFQICNEKKNFVSNEISRNKEKIEMRKLSEFCCHLGLKTIFENEINDLEKKHNC